MKITSRLWGVFGIAAVALSLLGLSAAGQIPLRDLAQSNATTGQVPKWDGSKWAASADTDTNSGGTLTGVGLSLPDIFNLSGSPLSGTGGTITATLATQAANTAFMGPTSGGAATPGFRGFVAADIPSLAASKITSGVLDTARLGSGTANSGAYLGGDSAWHVLQTLTDLGGVPTSRSLTMAVGSGSLTVSAGAQSLAADRTWTFDTAQDIRSSASPSFVGATITGLTASLPVVSSSGKALASMPYNTFAANFTSGLDAGAVSTGTLAVARGGTSFGSYTVGDILYASATGTLAKLGVGSNASIAYVNGSGLPAWSGALTNNRLMYMASGAPSGSSNLTFDGNTLTATQGATGSVGTIIKAIGSATADQLQVQDSSANVLVSWNSRQFQFQGHGAVGNIFIGRDDYPTSGSSIGAYNFHTAGSGSRVATGSWFAIAEEAFDATHFGTALVAQVAETGTSSSTQVRRMYIRGNGDIELNGKESALPTNATGGFTYLPNCGGVPTGSPTSRTGNTPFVYDSTDKVPFFHNGSTWQSASGASLINRSTGTSPSVTCGSADIYCWDFSGVHTGGAGTWTLPAASAGSRRLTFYHVQGGDVSNPFTVAAAGSDKITNAASLTNTSISMTANGSCRELVSDGVSKWMVVNSLGS